MGGKVKYLVWTSIRLGARLRRFADPLGKRALVWRMHVRAVPAEVDRLSQGNRCNCAAARACTAATRGLGAIGDRGEQKD